MVISTTIQPRNHTQCKREKKKYIVYFNPTQISSIFGHRKQKKSFFERIGLKKKPQPHYATSGSDVLEEQPQLSEEEDDDEEEEESCSSISSEEDEPVPQISVSSPTTSLNSVLPSYSSHDGKYIKTKTKHKKYDQEFSRLILAQTIQTSDIDYQQRRMSFDSSAEPSPNHPYGSVWSIRFSKDGKYFASAGQSCVVLLWKVLQNQQTEESIKVLDETPFMEYKGHKADILDLAWSKVNYFSCFCITLY